MSKAALIKIKIVRCNELKFFVEALWLFLEEGICYLS